MRKLALTVIAGLSIYYWFPSLDERLAIIAVAVLLFVMFRASAPGRAARQDFPPHQ